MIDWRRVLSANGVAFSEAGGPSTAKGNIYCACPWCKQGETGQHLGISLHGKGYGCWRVTTHRGKSPVRLLAALLHCSYDRASILLGFDGTSLESDETLSAVVSKILNSNTSQVVTSLSLLELPNSFKALNDEKVRYVHIERYFDYMKSRGYNKSAARELAMLFDFRFATDGPFAYRITIPIYDEFKTLVTWTARSMLDDQTLRYLTLSADPEKAEASRMPRARGPITDYLFCEERLLISGYYRSRAANCLIVCEGPFDAIRVIKACSEIPIPVWATCLFGKGLSDEQFYKLWELSHNFSHKILMLDRDAVMDGLKSLDRLSTIGFKSYTIPKPWKDPGEMPLSEIRKIIIEERWV